MRRSTTRRISATSSSLVSRSPARTHWATAASQPARLNTKVIAGSRPSRSSRSSTVIRDGGRNPTRRGGAPPRVRRARSHTAVADWRSSSRVAAHQLGVDLQLAVGTRVEREQVEQPVADHHVLPQRHRPVLVDDDAGVAAHGDQPVAELLGVAHRRRQADQRDVLGQLEDHLLPHRAAEPVGEVVHLVHDDVAEPVQLPGPGVDHVAQHLGGHDHHLGVAVDAGVAGEQADGADARGGRRGRRTSGCSAP